MKYEFFVQERTIKVDERILNDDINKTLLYKLKHIRSGITIIIHVLYLKNESETDRLNIIKEKLKSFINSDEITINELHINDISIK